MIATVEMVGPKCYGIFQPGNCRLVECSYGLAWERGAQGGRQLLFETREQAEDYLRKFEAIYHPPKARTLCPQ